MGHFKKKTEDQIKIQSAIEPMKIENQASKPSDMAVSMDKYCDCGNVRKRGFMLCSECLAYETSLEHSADISGEDY